MLSKTYRGKPIFNTSPQQRCQKLDRSRSAQWRCSFSKLILQILVELLALNFQALLSGSKFVNRNLNNKLNILMDKNQ